MNIHTFKLYRRLRNPRTGGVIISAFDLDRDCDDPFRERMKLCREFPQWAIGSDFKSPIDKEYEAHDDTNEQKVKKLYIRKLDFSDMLKPKYKDDPDVINPRQ